MDCRPRKAASAHMLAPGALQRPSRCGRWRPMQGGPTQSQMACQDARRAFPYMVAGEIPLTEWALLERHVGGCDECRPELDGLREQAAARVRALQRHARRSVLAAITALVVIGGATLYVHQYGLPEISRPESFRFSALCPSAAPEPSAPSPSPAPPASSVAKPLPAPAVSTQPTDLPTATGRAPPSGPTAPHRRPGARPPPAGPAPPGGKAGAAAGTETGGGREAGASAGRARAAAGP